MHRIDASGYAAGNTFTDGNPATGVPATVVDASWLNDIQETLAQTIEAAGLTLTEGDYTQLIDALIVNGMQGSYFNVAAAAGTANAITASYTPLITALVNGMMLYARASFANTTTTPTFTPNSGVIAAKAIVKGAGQALTAGDIAGGGHWIQLQYDATLGKWVLLNPANGINLDSRYIQASGATMTGALNSAPPVSLASAATVNIGAAASNNVTISGTTTITAFDTIAAGAVRKVTFSGSLTLTHNAASLILPSASNITTAAGDVAEFVSLGSGNWRCCQYQNADGTGIRSITLGTAQNSTSGVAIDFTGIPASAKRITVMFNGISTSGSSDVQIQIGSSTFDAAGYVGSYSGLAVSTITTSLLSGAGFQFNDNGAATSVRSGSATLILIGSNVWAFNGVMSKNDSARTMVTAGAKTLSGALDRIRITTINGTDTFDLGTINIMWEK